MIRAEIEANNAKAKQLADEQGLKTAQNVAAGVVGIVIWPVWFAMDAKGAAGTDATSTGSAHSNFLTTLATQRCAPGYRASCTAASFTCPACTPPITGYKQNQSHKRP